MIIPLDGSHIITRRDFERTEGKKKPKVVYGYEVWTEHTSHPDPEAALAALGIGPVYPVEGYAIAVISPSLHGDMLSYESIQARNAPWRDPLHALRWYSVKGVPTSLYPPVAGPQAALIARLQAKGQGPLVHWLQPAARPELRANMTWGQLQLFWLGAYGVDCSRWLIETHEGWSVFLNTGLHTLKAENFLEAWAEAQDFRVTATLFD